MNTTMIEKTMKQMKNMTDHLENGYNVTKEELSEVLQSVKDVLRGKDAEKTTEKEGTNWLVRSWGWTVEQAKAIWNAIVSFFKALWRRVKEGRKPNTEQKASEKVVEIKAEVA